jgi:hypothetical protein
MARSVEGPWFRASKDTWYATYDGRKRSLGVKGEKNGKAAQEAWHKLMANGPAVKPEPKPVAVTAGEVVDGYLTHQEGRVKPETLRWLKRWLVPFKAKYGKRPAENIAPHELETWANRKGWKRTPEFTPSATFTGRSGGRSASGSCQLIRWPVWKPHRPKAVGWSTLSVRTNTSSCLSTHGRSFGPCSGGCT